MITIWTNSKDAQWIDIYPPVASYVNGLCTDRYGVPITSSCHIHVYDYNNKILSYGLTQSGTGIFSITVSGIAVGSTVITSYTYEGTYNDLTDIAGSQFMTTVSGGLF